MTAAKKKTTKETKKKSNDESLREHVIYLLEGGGAHAKFDDVLEDLPPNLRGAKPFQQFAPHTDLMGMAIVGNSG